jgi:hypothetical protein
MGHWGWGRASALFTMAITLFGSTGSVLAQTISLTTPVVPPLLQGEAPPSHMPNYFDTRELGAAVSTYYFACSDTFDGVNAPDEEKAAFCDCVGDGVRQNARAGRTLSVDDAQAQKCLAYAKTRTGRSPLAAGLWATTAGIMDGLVTCMDAFPSSVPAPYATSVCACTVNAALKSAGAAPKRDLDRCDIMARYWTNTGQFLTQRQFAALVTEPSSVAQAPLAPPVTGPFIPYAGNGLGPSLCADGMLSHSSGRGTCSGHGGIAGGRHRRH